MKHYYLQSALPYNHTFTYTLVTTYIPIRQLAQSIASNTITMSRLPPVEKLPLALRKNGMLLSPLVFGQKSQ